jgi:hypothetical protein
LYIVDGRRAKLEKGKKLGRSKRIASKRRGRTAWAKGVVVDDK